MNKKKVIVITISSIIAIALIATLIYLLVINSNKPSETPIINTVNSKLKENNKFVFTTTLDDNNKVYYAKNNDKVYIDSYYEGVESKFIIREGNTYLIKDEYKSYYTYENNITELEKITAQFDNLSQGEPVKGKEKIDGKEYNYDEYTGITRFVIQDLMSSEENIDEQNIKTRFYYKGDKLLYIKTIVGSKEELLKVDISYDVDDNLFNIPSGYEEG